MANAPSGRRRATRDELLRLVYLLVDTTPLLRELASHVNGLSGRRRLRLRRLADATDEIAPRLPPR